MNFRRIRSTYIRYAYNMLSFDHATELFFWPLLDIFIWGITIVWLQRLESSFSIVLPILTALVFWQVVWRSNYEVSVNILKDLWARNFVNLFSTPLKSSEWIASLMLLGLTKNIITILFGSACVFGLYKVNIFSLGAAFFPYFLSLVIAGWWSGFISASIIVYFGQRMQMIAWVAGYVLSPFSAVFYPLSALPPWCLPIAKALPTTYVFEGIRQYYKTGVFDWQGYGLSLVLNGLYLCVALWLFVTMFEKSRQKGLARLE